MFQSKVENRQTRLAEFTNTKKKKKNGGKKHLIGHLKATDINIA